MTDAQGIRKHYGISYRYLVKTTMVSALRAAFNNLYDRDPQFQNLRVVTEYPLTEVGYPAIVVNYRGGTVRAAGVGHEEYFKDGNGNFRQWDHRYFKGGIDFTVLALSPTDRDILSDSLIDLLSFGRLDPQLAEFFYTVYGTPSDEIQSFMTQLALNTDELIDGGESVGPVPWGSEDQLAYQGSVSMDCFGAFYNSNVTNTVGLVWGVNQFPAAYWEDIDLSYRPDLAWQPPFVYVEDPSDGIAAGTAAPSGSDTFV